MMHNYQDIINEDEFMVSVKILVAATICNLNNKLAGSRANIIFAMDAIHNVQGATSIPSSQLSTLLIQRH
jgi:hypothetical protein